MAHYEQPKFVCEHCGADIYDTDHLEWTDLILCVDCYDKYVLNNSIELNNDDE